MDALILSCGTGGGHNAAAAAIREELERRGDRARVMNPYSLVSERRVRQIDGAYISLARRAPKGFGVVYRLGDLYRRSGHRSPVYFLNYRTAQRLGRYLQDHPVDVLIAPHLFPAEVFTQMKYHGMARPKTIFVATDYTCIPFTEETDCDAYVIPSPQLTEEFVGRGIPAEKLYPLGIPVRQSFARGPSKAEARQALGVAEEGPLYLLSGGSMGAGVLKEAVERLYRQSRGRIAVICGSNSRLYRELEGRMEDRLILLARTERMDLWLRACDIYFTKPGGLSSTEAAVVGVPLVHLPPIPGCETINARFFQRRGMSILYQKDAPWLAELLAGAEEPERWTEMIARQHREIDPNAAGEICDLAHTLAEGKR